MSPKSRVALSTNYSSSDDKIKTIPPKKIFTVVIIYSPIRTDIWLCAFARINQWFCKYTFLTLLYIRPRSHEKGNWLFWNILCARTYHELNCTWTSWLGSELYLKWGNAVAITSHLHIHESLSHSSRYPFQRCL